VSVRAVDRLARARARGPDRVPAVTSVPNERDQHEDRHGRCADGETARFQIGVEDDYFGSCDENASRAGQNTFLTLTLDEILGVLELTILHMVRLVASDTPTQQTDEVNQ
jgi:hypothetical protein